MCMCDDSVVLPMALKTCPKCKIVRPVVEFFKNKSNGDGFSDYCKECSLKENNSRHERNRARENIIIPEIKTCPRCKIEKLSLCFNKNKNEIDGLQTYCKECGTIQQRKTNYGLSDEQYRAMLRGQGGACAICKFVPGPGDRPLDVDHEHVEGWEEMSPEERRLYIRGLLCQKCNRGLGYFKDNIAIVGKAIEYLNGPTLGIRYSRSLSGVIKNAILASQNGLCKICFADLSKTRACLDHCYRTGLIRGYLCHGCNCGLGQLKDSLERLNNAVNYLMPYSPSVAGKVVFQ